MRRFQSGEKKENDTQGLLPVACKASGDLGEAELPGQDSQALRSFRHHRAQLVHVWIQAAETEVCGYSRSGDRNSCGAIIRQK